MNKIVVIGRHSAQQSYVVADYRCDEQARASAQLLNSALVLNTCIVDVHVVEIHKL